MGVSEGRCQGGGGNTSSAMRGKFGTPRGGGWRPCPLQHCSQIAAPAPAQQQERAPASGRPCRASQQPPSAATAACGPGEAAQGRQTHLHRLVVAEHLGLLQHGIHQRGLACTAQRSAARGQAVGLRQTRGAPAAGAHAPPGAPPGGCTAAPGGPGVAAAGAHAAAAPVLARTVVDVGNDGDIADVVTAGAGLAAAGGGGRRRCRAGQPREGEGRRCMHDCPGTHPSCNPQFWLRGCSNASATGRAQGQESVAPHPPGWRRRRRSGGGRRAAAGAAAAPQSPRSRLHGRPAAGLGQGEQAGACYHKVHCAPPRAAPCICAMHLLLTLEHGGGGRRAQARGGPSDHAGLAHCGAGGCARGCHGCRLPGKEAGPEGCGWLGCTCCLVAPAPLHEPPAEAPGAPKLHLGQHHV